MSKYYIGLTPDGTSYYYRDRGIKNIVDLDDQIIAKPENGKRIIYKLGENPEVTLQDPNLAKFRQIIFGRNLPGLNIYDVREENGGVQALPLEIPIDFFYFGDTCQRDLSVEDFMRSATQFLYWGSCDCDLPEPESAFDSKHGTGSGGVM